LLGFVALGVGLRLCWRALSPTERWHVRWLLLGALLSLVPVVGSFPSTRLTLAAFLGVAPALALLLRQIARQLYDAPRIGLPRFLGYYALGLSLTWLQLIAPLEDNIRAQVDDFATTTEWVLGADLDVERVAQQRVFLLGGSEFTTTFFFAYIWSQHGRPLPLSYHPITTAPFAESVQRVADDVLVVRALGGGFLGSGQESMFHASYQLWREGQSVQLDGMRVQAEQVDKGLPLCLRLTFDRSLDDPSYVFLASTPHGIERFELPAVGHSQLVPRAAYPSWIGMQRERYERRVDPPSEMLGFASPPGFVVYEPP
jgi:hypothetical protein